MRRGTREVDRRRVPQKTCLPTLSDSQEVDQRSTLRDEHSNSITHATAHTALFPQLTSIALHSIPEENRISERFPYPCVTGRRFRKRRESLRPIDCWRPPQDLNPFYRRDERPMAVVGSPGNPARIILGRSKPSKPVLVKADHVND